MALDKTAEQIIKRKLDQVSQTISIELKALCPKKSGSASSAIAIYVDSEYQRFVGCPINWSNHRDPGVHMYYANYGNGGSGAIIRPTRSRALRLEDGAGNTIGYADFVRGYTGNMFIQTVASHHR